MFERAETNPLRSSKMKQALETKTNTTWQRSLYIWYHWYKAHRGYTNLANIIIIAYIIYS